MYAITQVTYWSAYISRAIFILTLVLTPVMMAYFAAYLAGLALVAGLSPMDLAFDFILEASGALTDRLLLLGLFSALFAALSLIGRWLLWQGNDRQINPDFLHRNQNPLALLFSALLRPVSWARCPVLSLPASLTHSSRRNLSLSSTPAASAGADPLQI